MNFVVDIYDHTGKHLQSVLFHKLRDAIALAQCHNESIKVIVKNRQSEEVVHMKLYGESGRWSSTDADAQDSNKEPKKYRCIINLWSDGQVSFNDELCRVNFDGDLVDSRVIEWSEDGIQS